MDEKMVPQNIEAEKAVLGSLLHDKDAIYMLMDIIRPDSFYKEKHSIIYESILDLVNDNKPVDIITVSDDLKNKKLLDKVSGFAYIASLYEEVPNARNAEHYARIVSEKATMRELMLAASNINKKAREGDADVEFLLDEAEKLILEVAEKGRKEGFSSIKDVLNDAIDQLEYLIKHKGDISGIPTFRDLDKLLLGLHKSDMLIVAARPGMGKTSFALNIAYKAAKQGYPVAIFSLEMSKDQLVTRMLSSEAMVDQQKLRSGNLNMEDMERISKAAHSLADLPIYIDDTPGISVMEIRGKSRKLKAEKDLGLIIIDYLQLMQSHKKIESRQQEVSEISRSLKALARELDVPLIALSQLSRAVEQTSDKIPALSHLRESGSLEQDSDCVMFIHRPEYYDKESEKKNIAEIIIAKHRHGPTGTVDLAFFAEMTKFADLSR